MRVSLLAIGKMKKGPESELLVRYRDRAEKAARQLGVSGVSVSELTESKAANSDMRKAEEAGWLLDQLKPGAFLVALDEHGKDLPSIELAGLVRKCLDNGTPEMAFAIGGPDGHGPDLLKSANLVLRFGKMTWPHQLARIMAAEQIYRSVTILTGHPYHRV